MTEDYLLNRANLICLFVLIDSRLKPQNIDQEFMQWLSKEKIPFVMVFTKSDKLGKIALMKNIQDYNTKMLKKWEELPKSFIASAKKKTGLNEIIKYISSLNSKFKEILTTS